MARNAASLGCGLNMNGSHDIAKLKLEQSSSGVPSAGSIIEQFS